MAFQERVLLNLNKSDDYQIIKKILASPLGLSVELINMIFEKKFDKIQEQLDTIKQFVAGVERAKQLGKDYSLAYLYPNLFSFHQFFQSSYRARQGKSLEELIKSIIKNCGSQFTVPDKLKEKKELLAEVFENYDSNLDIDVIASKNKKEILIVQLRSRDDTGGTTAKSSLVEALRDALEFKTKKGATLVYLVSIWDIINSTQKSITIKKIYSSLKGSLGKITEEEFVSKFEEGIEVREGIILKLTYGTDALVKSISDWIESVDNMNPETIKELIIKLVNWDDLWLAYSIASLELENLKLKNFDNVTYLNGLLKKTSFEKQKFNEMDYHSTINYVDKITNEIIPKWKEDSIVLESVSDRAHYIRDLILLKVIYEVSKT